MTDDEPLRIWWNKNLRGKISPGKLAAHAAHAALHAYGIRYTHPIVVLGAGRGRIEAMEVVIRDEGRTELTPGTVTAGVERARAVLGDRDALREKHDMSELQEVQAAGAKVLTEMQSAFERGELSDATVAIGFRLLTVAHMMKAAHQPGALRIAREYADAVGLDFELLDEQVQARIYEHVQAQRIEASFDLEPGGSGS